MVDLRYLIRAFLSFNSEGVEVKLEDAFEMAREVVELDSLEEGASCLAEA
jgi:cysteine synthase